MKVRNTSLLLIALAFTVLIYSPGITGGFAFDDYSTIVNNPFVLHAKLEVNSLIDAGWSGWVAGKLRRPIPMISFALNAIVANSAPLTYKLTNIAIHLINGWLLFILFRILVLRESSLSKSVYLQQSAAMVAMFATAIWLVHPLNLTTVLYVVQRMTSLASLFTLLALLCYCHGREKQLIGKSGSFFIYFFTPCSIVLGIFSKENAVLTVPLIALVELCFYKFECRSNTQRSILIGAYSLVSAVVLVAFVLFINSNPEWLSERYEYRSFSAAERLITEARVLWFYLYLMAIPRLSEFALFHDDIPISISLFEPLSSLFAVTFGLLVIVVAVIYFKRLRLFSFAVLWFCIGHLIESSVIPLDVAHEHRNYLPSMAIYFSCAIGAFRVGKKYYIKVPFQPLALVIILALGALTMMRSSAWSDPVTLANVEASHHPNSFRSVYAAARVQFEYYKLRGQEDDRRLAIERMKKAAELTEENALPYIALINLYYGSGETPPKLWHVKIRERLKNELTRMPEAAALAVLSNCHLTKADCAIPVRTVTELYYAAMQNPKLRPMVRAKILTDFAKFNIQVLGDLPLSLSLAQEATHLMPNSVEYRELLVQALIFNKRYSQAQNQIDQLTSRRFWKEWITVPATRVRALEDLLRREMGGTAAIAR